MKSIFHEKFNRKIKEEFSQELDITEKGLYIIQISARCRSEKQIGKGETDDDDLRIEIDGRKFSQLNNPTRYFDSPAAFSGGQLHNLKKIVFFFIYFSKGKHKLTFIPDKEPKLEEISVQFVGNKVSNIELDINNQAEDGDRRSWITFALVDLPLKQIQTEIKTERRRFDSDDVKIIINDEAKRNLRNIFRKLWFWIGSFFTGETQTGSFDLDLQRNGLHYIEFWADRKPTLYWVKLDLGEEIDFRIKARIVWKEVYLRSDPKQNDNILIPDVTAGEEVIILQKAVKGERPLNENKKPLASDRWHKVEYKKSSGFIYSEALETEGEDEGSIKKLIVQKSEELKEDVCLMLAIAWRESRFFPYGVSKVDDRGLFQLKEAAVEDVNDEFKKNFDNRFDIHQNIEAGILYFKLVKEKYKGRDNFWEKCLAGWNRGWNKIEPDEPFIMNEQPIETQEFIKDVFEYWEHCKKNLKKTGKGLLLSVLLVSVLSALAIVSFFFLKKEPFAMPSIYKDHFLLDEKRIDIDKDGKEEKMVVINDKPNSTFGITKILLIRKDGSFLELPDDESELQWFKVGDFNKNGKAEIAVLFGYSGSGGWGQFYLYEWSDSRFITLLSRDEMGSDAHFNDLDNDGVEEILFGFYPKKWGFKYLQVYKWDKKNSSYNLSYDLKDELDVWREKHCPRCLVSNQ